MIQKYIPQRNEVVLREYLIRFPSRIDESIIEDEKEKSIRGTYRGQVPMFKNRSSREMRGGSNYGIHQKI